MVIENVTIAQLCVKKNIACVFLINFNYTHSAEISSASMISHFSEKHGIQKKLGNAKDITLFK